jgi:hypothetical protein
MSMPGGRGCSTPSTPTLAAAPPAPSHPAAVAYTDESQIDNTNNQGIKKSRTATCLCANGTRIVITAVYDSAGDYVGPESAVQRACTPAACRRAGVMGGQPARPGVSAESMGIYRVTRLWDAAG